MQVSVEEGEKLQTRTQERKRITWTTVSAGPNIIAASFAALVGLLNTALKEP